MNFNVKFEEITLGADPEYAAASESLGVIPAAYFRTALKMRHLPHPKHPLYYAKDGIKIIEDGVAFELTVPPAHNGNWQQLLGSIHKGIDVLKLIFNQYKETCDGIVIAPAIPYKFGLWNTFGDEMIFANQAGCDKDEDAFDDSYTGDVIDMSTHPWRYFGGHMHFSGHPLFKIAPKLAIQGMAMGPGLAAVLGTSKPDLERQRTFLYGKAGKFRPQKYPNPDGGEPIIGIEYRTPSNSWTDPDNIPLGKDIFDAAKFTVERLLNFPDTLLAMSHEIGEEVTKAIATCDREQALELSGYLLSRV